jgi:hypothetical protein
MSITRKYLVIFSKIIPYVVALLIVTSWFRSKTMIATAEEGLPFYNLNRTFSIYKSFFYDTGLGLNGFFNIPRFFIFGFLSIFQKFGFEGWQIQAGLYYLLLLSPLIAVPKLVAEFVDKKRVMVGNAASIFYLFNLFTMSQVWTRFILSLICLWSFLPLFLFLWVRFIKTQKLRYLFILLIYTFVYSPAFVILSPAITLWVPAMLFTLFKIIESQQKVKVFIITIFGFIVWVLANSWWIYPAYNNRNIGVTNVSPEQNYTSLVQVSEYFPNNQIFQLKQKYMLGPNSPYYELYKSPIRNLIVLCILYLVILGLVKYRKTNSFYFLLSILILSWWLIKGTNPPYGFEFFKFMFSKLQPFQLFRNPYEKAGALFLIPYSIFFAVGLNFVLTILKRSNIIISYGMAGVLCIYLSLPIADGSLFLYKTHIIVPEYYDTLNKLIEVDSIGDDSRILHLPLLRGSSVNTDWNYFGEEPSEFLFDKTSISRTLSDPFIDRFYNKLGEPKYFYSSKNFPKILAVMKVKYIILHSDYLPSIYNQENVDSSRNILASWNNIEPIKQIGRLELYKNIISEGGRLYLADTVFQAKNLEEVFDLITSDKFDPNSDVTTQEHFGSSVDIDLFEIPEHNVRKISSTDYKINVKNVNKPFFVVLANSYNVHWQAKIDGKVINDHILVNGFANGWNIENKGNFEIDLSYYNL